jgi:FkbM family methyltransferase
VLYPRLCAETLFGCRVALPRFAAPGELVTALPNALRSVAELRLPYRIDRAINRAAAALGSRERTIRRAGFRFRVRRLTCDEAFVANVVEQREYLRHGLAIQSTDTVIDIGGNIGTFAVLAASLARQGRVISVEPDPENLRLLRENVEANRVPVTIVNGALADCTGPLTLHVAEAGGGFHTIDAPAFARTYSAAIQVQAWTLADLWSDYNIDRCAFLKHDCEGAEFAILRATPREVLDRVDQIAMEYHASQDDKRIVEMMRTLEAAGLRVVHREQFPTRGGHIFLRRLTATYARESGGRRPLT